MTETMENASADGGRELMLRFQGGDPSAFDRLVKEFEGPVVRFILRFVPDVHRAEDLAQETFLRVYRSRRTYRPMASFRTWLFTIVNRLCLNEIRSRVRERRVIAPAQARDGDPRDPRAENPHAALQEEELALVIRGAIAELPETQRTAILLNKYEGMSYQEIAGVLGISMMAVKSLLTRARRKLREKLLPYIEAGDAQTGITDDRENRGHAGGTHDDGV